MLVIGREDNWKGKLSKRSTLEQLEYMLVFNVWGRHKSAVHILILQALALNKLLVTLTNLQEL